MKFLTSETKFIDQKLCIRLYIFFILRAHDINVYKPIKITNFIYYNLII